MMRVGAAKAARRQKEALLLQQGSVEGRLSINWKEIKNLMGTPCGCGEAPAQKGGAETYKDTVLIHSALGAPRLATMVTLTETELEAANKAVVVG